MTADEWIDWCERRLTDEAKYCIKQGAPAGAVKAALTCLKGFGLQQDKEMPPYWGQGQSVDKRPANCRFRLQDEGKAYPRSSCQGCGKTITTGLGKKCSIASEPVPNPPQEQE